MGVWFGERLASQPIAEEDTFTFRCPIHSLVGWLQLSDAAPSLHFLCYFPADYTIHCAKRRLYTVSIFLSELAGWDQTHVYVLNHDDNCDLKRIPKHAAVLVARTHLTIFLWPPLDCEIILTAGRHGVQKDAERILFHFLLSQSDVDDVSEKKCELAGFRVLPNAPIVSEKILTFSGGLTWGIARDGHWASMPAQKPICHEQTLFMPCVSNNNYKGPSLCGQKTVTARPRLLAAAAGGRPKLI